MYIDGFLTPVPKENKEKYLQHLEVVYEIMKDFGMTRVVEAWGDDIPKGKINDFLTAVHAKSDEAVLFSWFEWPNKETRDKGLERIFQDERLRGLEMPFDGTRMMFGGFTPIFEKSIGEK